MTTTNYNVDIIDIIEIIVILYIGIKTKDSNVLRRVVSRLSTRQLDPDLPEEVTDFEV
jgi:hypothetical protein